MWHLSFGDCAGFGIEEGYRGHTGLFQRRGNTTNGTNIVIVIVNSVDGGGRRDRKEQMNIMTQ